jgi:UDP-2,4-diacetamido-2,4,6-trideoxy-beta-L-altropyranose hydrolase
MAHGDQPLVVIRADGGPELGHGHVRRCLNVADYLRSEGFQLVFVLRGPDHCLLSLVQNSKFRVIELPTENVAAVTAFDHEIGEKEFTSMAQDALETASALKRHLPNRSIAWVITDHLFIRSPWQAEFRALTRCRVLAIDGQANYTHDADILVDPQLSDAPFEKWRMLIPDHCQLFSGPACLPLPKAFVVVRSKAAIRSHPMSRILVCFGGSDPRNVVTRTVKVLMKWLLTRNQTAIAVDLVIPEKALCRDEIAHSFGHHGQLTVHAGIDDLAPLMLAASLSLGGGGIMMWERCMLGLPAIVVPLAPNQVKPIANMASKGSVLALRSLGGHYEQDLRMALDHMINDQTLLANLSGNAFDIMWGWPDSQGWLNSLKSLTHE